MVYILGFSSKIAESKKQSRDQELLERILTQNSGVEIPIWFTNLVHNMNTVGGLDCLFQILKQQATPSLGGSLNHIPVQKAGLSLRRITSTCTSGCSSPKLWAFSSKKK